MITCKEDLINTYIENDHGELRDLYIEKMKEHGIRSCGDSDFKYLHEGKKKYIACMTEFNKNGQCEWSCYASDVDDLKQLTLSDLKPTKESTAVETLERMGYEWHGGELWKPPLGKPKFEVEYVKAEFDNAWQAVKAFEDGEELYTYFQVEGWVLVGHAQQVVPNWQVEKLYRRTEKQVDWRDECLEFLCETSLLTGDDDIRNCIKISELESEFLELCRTALRSRGEL